MKREKQPFYSLIKSKRFKFKRILYFDFFLFLGNSRLLTDWFSNTAFVSYVRQDLNLNSFKAFNWIKKLELWYCLPTTVTFRCWAHVLLQGNDFYVLICILTCDDKSLKLSFQQRAKSLYYRPINYFYILYQQISKPQFRNFALNRFRERKITWT